MNPPSTFKAGCLRRAMYTRISRAELAAILGVTRHQVAAWQEGTEVPSTVQIEVIAKVTGVTVAYLMDESRFTFDPALLPAPPADQAKSHLRDIGLTQGKAAERLKVTESYLCRVLNGHLKSQRLINKILNLGA